MREILIKLHNASLCSFDGESVEDNEELVFKTFEKGIDYFNSLLKVINEMGINFEEHAEFGSVNCEIEVNNDVHCIIDIESSTCSILYTVDRDYINSLNIMFNQDEIYSISSDVSQASLDQLLAPESDFFLVEIDDELYVFDTVELESF